MAPSPLRRSMPYHVQHVSSPSHRRNVLMGGALLTGSAGFVNAALLGFFQVPVSHMSGAVSHLGVFLGERSLGQAFAAFAVVGAFFLGCATSGAILGDGARPGRRYVVALLVEALALAAAARCLTAHLAAGVPLAAFACGVQNAMSSSYYGLAVRTTHVTGMVTDLGVILGRRLRGQRIPRWKTLLLGSSVSAFLIGGVLGAASIRWLDYRVLYVPALGTLAAAAAYWARLELRRAIGHGSAAATRAA